MRRRMVAHDRFAASCIHLSGKFAGDTCHAAGDERHLVHDQHRQTVLALAVEHLKALIIQTQTTGVAYLTTHLRVEGVLGDDDLEERLAFLLHATETKDLGLYGELVVAHELRLAFLDDIPVAQVLLVRRATHLFLVREGFVILLLVGGETVLAKDEFREVKREAVGVLEREDIDTGDLGLTGFLCLVHQLVEETDTLVEGTEECFLLGFDDRHDLRLLLHQLGVRFAQVRDELRHELVEEGLTHIQEGIAVPHGTAQDTTDDVTGFLIRGQLAVGDSECYRTDMIGDDTHGDVGLLVLAILTMTDLADFLQHRLENIGVVVRGLTLDGTHEALEAHTGVDHFLCQGFQRTVRLTVELHEDDVPDLDDLRVVLVDQLPSRHFGALLGGTTVHVDLTTRTAGTGLTHLPEVIMLVAVQDMIGRQMFEPDRSRLVVATQTLLGRTLKDRRVEVSRVDLQDINDILPCKINRLLLEVVAERPVA